MSHLTLADISRRIKPSMEKTMPKKSKKWIAKEAATKAKAAAKGTADKVVDPDAKKKRQERFYGKPK